MNRPRRHSSGFTLIEVMAAFVIALLLLAPVTAMLGGVAGTFAGLQRSADRRMELQQASVAAMAAFPLQPGEVTVGRFLVTVLPFSGPGPSGLERSGWQLVRVIVQDGRQPGPPLLETLRIAAR